MRPIQILCNVRIASYGFDVPCLSAMIDASPTDGRDIHVQKFGRVLRPDPAPLGARAYQAAMLRDTEEAIERGHNPLINAPTGSGKSHIVAEICRRAVANGHRIGYLVDRRALIYDLAKRLTREGIRFGVLMAGHPLYNLAAPVQIGSVDTLYSRQICMEVDAIIIDEARKSLSPKWDAVIALHPGARLIGLDATPVAGMTKRFDYMVEGPTVAALQAGGYLVPYKALTVHEPDVTGTDFLPSKLAEIMSERTITGNVVDTWMRLASDRRTILFAPTKECSMEYARRFQDAGVEAVHVDDQTPDAEREVIYQRLALDAPEKRDALILDHAGNCNRLNCTPSHILGWSLTDGKPRMVSDDDPSLAGRHCKQCFRFFFSSVKKCPDCGMEVPKSLREIKIAEGELVEFKKRLVEDRKQQYAASSPLKAKYFAIRDAAASKGQSVKYAKFQFVRAYRTGPAKGWDAEWETKHV